MFKQIEIESWQDLIAALLFLFFIIVFVGVCIRVLTTKQKKIDTMANLPLEDESDGQSANGKNKHE